MTDSDEPRDPSTASAAGADGFAVSGERRILRSADGIPLHYTVFGSSELTFILIHGWSCDQDFWRYQARPSIRGFQIVSLDLAGHGRSRATLGQRSWSMEEYAADVEAIADTVGARTIVLIGHSMGGAIAIEAALRLGSRCRLVIGVDTFTDAAFYRRRPSAEITARRAAFATDFAGAIGAMIDQITAPGVDRATSAWISLVMAQTDPAIASAVLGQLLEWDIEARWPLLRCPVETMNSALLARGNEHLTLDGLIVHAIDDVGHFPMLEEPATFNALVGRIVTRHFPP